MSASPERPHEPQPASDEAVAPVPGNGAGGPRPPAAVAGRRAWSPTPGGEHGEEEEDDLRNLGRMAVRLWGVLRRRWPVAVVIAVVGTLAVGVRLGLLPDEYESEGMVQVGMYSDVLTAESDRSGRGASMAANTHLRLLTSDEVVATAMENLGREVPEGPGRKEAIEEFLEDMEIEPIEDTFLVHVKTGGPEAEQVADRVNALMDAFIPFSNEFIGARYVVQERRLREVEETIREKLRKAEERLQELYEDMGNIEFEDRRRALVDSQEQLQKRITDLQIQRAQVDAERERLARSLEEDADSEDIEVLIGRLQEEDLLERLAPLTEMRAKLLRLGTVLQKDHPEYVEARLELEARERAIRKSLKEAGRVALAGLEQESEVLGRQEEKLEKLLAEVKADLVELDKQEGLYSSVTREVEWYDEELESTREKLRRAEGRSNVQMAATIVNRAEVPAEPVSRFTPLVVVLTVVGMSALGLFVIVVWDRVEDTISSEETARLLGIPVLGWVPAVDVKKGSERELLEETADSARLSRTAEAFRMLRTNLTFAAAGVKNSAILVTSGTPGDGKTFTTLHLATALAAEGRTLLIEGDLRRPRMQEILGTLYQQGLSDVLAGLSSLEEAAQPSGLAGLDLLPAGSEPPNPADLLVRGHFEEVLRAAVERYDYVVVDSPPGVGISDPSLMAPLVKGVLFVVKMHVSRRRLAQAAIEQVEAVGGNPLGVVLNGVTRHDGLGYGYYGYYSPYGGAYGADRQRETRSEGVGATTPASGAGEAS